MLLETYLGRWYARFARLLARPHVSLWDTVWEEGVLELVSPVEPTWRHEAAGLGVGLPWGGRLDHELYWRILYAAFAETLRPTIATTPTEDRRAMVRTAVTAAIVALIGSIGNVERHYGRVLSADIALRAADDLRIRTTKPRPKPVRPETLVTLAGVPALVDGFTGDGLIRLSRETAPEADTEAAWRLDPATGRHLAIVVPNVLDSHR